MARLPDDVDPATLRLVVASGLGPATLRRLRARFDDDAAIVAASASHLSARADLSPGMAEAIRRAIDAVDVDEERRRMGAHQARIVLDCDGDYPGALAEVPGAPAALWVRGDPVAIAEPGLAIVGSRRASPYGLGQAARFARGVVEAGLVVVSGGAIGIDAAAHEAALRLRGCTVAVLGCGLSHAYPRRHARLFERMVAGGGALVSDFPMAVPPRPGHFPARNRIVSGLSHAVLVVEAARRSGALITARLATEEHGREVLALPGRVDVSTSAGTNALIRDGGAALVTTPEELVEHLRLFTPFGRRPAPAPAVTGMDDAADRVLSIVAAAREPVPTDAILAEVEGAMATLVVLEIGGRIARQGGGWVVAAD